MHKRFNVGELRTQIIIKALEPNMDADGYPTETFTPIYGDGVSIGCKWVNVHGREVYEAERLNLREAATLTVRYTSLVNQRCRIWRSDELGALPYGASDEAAAAIAYEIVSVDDIQNRHELLEIKVKRVVVA
ncbi:MAG: head-tail adaptor protein [Clostridia bacterium]